MGELAILDVVIGLGFIYLVLSLICTTINELFANVLFTVRASTLKKGIAEILDGEGGAMTEKFYKHAAIKSLFGPRFWKSRQARHPSFVPPRVFSRVLFDILTAEERAEGQVAATVEGARKVVASKYDNAVQEKLLPLLDEARGDIESARKKVEIWYDDTMDRVSGWYRRKMQTFALLWAVVIACASNADTLMLFDILWRDSAVRASVTALAEQAAKQDTPPRQGDAQARYREALERLHLLGWNVKWGSAEAKGREVAGEGGEGRVEDGRDDPRILDLSSPGAAGAIAKKIVGLLLTVLAVSLGAPFWFDVLGKFTRLKAAGNTPVSKPNERQPSGTSGGSGTPPVNSE